MNTGIFINIVQVTLGDHNLDIEGETTLPEHRLGVADYILHNDYNYQLTGMLHDIVLLELWDHVYLDIYTPACLPMNYQDLTGKIATVAGWGQTDYTGGDSDVLLEVGLPIVSNRFCAKKMNFEIHPGQICAGGEKGRDSCQVELENSSRQSLIFLLQGDSGGPMTVKNKNDQHVLEGAVSTGLRCGVKDKFGLFTRINHYRHWIEKNMKNPKFCQSGPYAKEE